MNYFKLKEKNLAKLSFVGAITFSFMSISITTVNAGHHENVYGPYPITEKSYNGPKKNSVSYGGQMARQLLHNSLKKLASKGNPKDPTLAPEKKMLAYFNTKDKSKSLPILDPINSLKFPVKQKMIGELSGGANLSGKADMRIQTSWPGNMSGADVIKFMIKKAGKTKDGVDTRNGMNYPQLISKYTMGAVLYHQACDNYLDEKMTANSKPNNKPYKKGAYYTGKEHSWDEAFGYWGAAAHTMKLTPAESYNIAKKKNFKAADYNKDGVVDLQTEMTYAHAYYASSYDKTGKTNYLKTVTGAFIDGRKVITEANGNKLSKAQLDKIQNYVQIICSNWEDVIAESVFKYAGSVYKDLSKIEKALDSGSSMDKAMSKYLKHWGELKGFAMALQAGRENKSDTFNKLNRMMGFGPLLPNLSQVVGIDSSGDYTKDQGSSIGYYKLHMLKIQNLMADKYALKAKVNDATGGMAALLEEVGTKKSAEND
jgi:hypothetical protein